MALFASPYFFYFDVIMTMDNPYLQSAKRVIELELQAITQLLTQLGDAFNQACATILGCTGRTVVIGIGKSSHIGNKIAASLASTGTPAFFVHAGEACHGDLGMIMPNDVVIAISNSGETTEFITLLPQLKWLKVPVIALCGKRDSSLGAAADIYLDASVAIEACPLGLAPTSSTTVALVIGDALAVALLEARGFTPIDFARTHPGGNIGKRLLLTVQDLMLTGPQIPIVPMDASLKETIAEVNRKGLGVTLIVDTEQQLFGVFTDGDLRRAIEQQLDLTTTCISQFISRGGKKIAATTLATEAVCLMEQFNITSLAIVDAQERPMGIIHLHHLIKAGVA